MAKYPAIPLYTDAYLADTRHLAAAQHGAYLLLPMMAWRQPDCALPDDDETLSRWASMDLRTWLRNRDAVLAFWKMMPDGRWQQPGSPTNAIMLKIGERRMRKLAGLVRSKGKEGTQRMFNQTPTRIHLTQPQPLLQILKYL